MSGPSPPRAPPPHEPYAALHFVPFRWFVASLFAMTLASQMQAVVVGWLIYQATHDPLALGLVGLAEVVPYVLVALFAGYVVDRSDRRRVSVWALFVLLLASIALFTTPLVGMGSGTVWPYYAIIAVCGVARSFLQIARSALVSEIVPHEHFANAATWRSSTWQLGTVVGPAAGGLLFATAGVRVAFSCIVVLSAIALAAMLALRHTPTPPAPTSGSMVRDLAEGLHFLRRERVILGALTLDMLAVLFGGAVALLPVFAVDILRVGPRGLGLLQAAPGAGAVTMAIILAHRPPFRRAGPVLFGVVALFGAAMVGFALSTSFALSLALLYISGAADNVSAVIRSTLLQVLVPPAMLGRVSAVNAIFIGSSNELGAFESGVAARWFGTVLSVAAGGVVTLLVVGFMVWRVPELLQLRGIARPEKTPQEVH